MSAPNRQGPTQLAFVVQASACWPGVHPDKLKLELRTPHSPSAKWGRCCFP
jgi:hypothetical protein